MHVNELAQGTVTYPPTGRISMQNIEAEFSGPPDTGSKVWHIPFVEKLYVLECIALSYGGKR